LTTTLTWISWYQNVSISDFIGANGDEGGGNNWNYIIRAKFQSKCHHQQTNTQFFLQPDALPVAQPMVSKH